MKVIAQSIISGMAMLMMIQPAGSQTGSPPDVDKLRSQVSDLQKQVSALQALVKQIRPVRYTAVVPTPPGFKFLKGSAAQVWVVRQGAIACNSPSHHFAYGDIFPASLLASNGQYITYVTCEPNR